MLQISKKEQDYLKVIFMLEAKQPRKAVSINSIAKQLAVSSPSSTEMVKRLSKKNLVHYTPYKGVTLSEIGKVQARFIIKSHRVWETFLVEKLGYLPEEVHDEAENLEHASSPKLVEHLYALLEYPETDPHGAIIPPELFWKETTLEIALNQSVKGKNYYIISVTDEVKDYFKSLGTPVPHLIKVIERLKDFSLLIKHGNGQITTIPLFLQDTIHIIEKKGKKTFK